MNEASTLRYGRIIRLLKQRTSSTSPNYIIIIMQTPIHTVEAPGLIQGFQSVASKLNQIDSVLRGVELSATKAMVAPRSQSMLG